MKHISIIVPDGQTNLTTVACIVGAYEIFTKANEHWKGAGKKEAYKVQLVGVSKTVDFDNRLLTINPQVNIHDIDKTNLVVIPSLVRNFQQAVKGNQVLVDWFRSQYKNGAEIAAMCTGAFMLASSGLLMVKIALRIGLQLIFSEHFFQR